MHELSIQKLILSFSLCNLSIDLSMLFCGCCWVFLNFLKWKIFLQVKYENEAVFELFTHFPFFVVGVYPRILFLSAIDTEIDQFSEKCPLELNLKKKH